MCCQYANVLTGWVKTLIGKYMGIYRCWQEKYVPCIIYFQYNYIFSNGDEIYILQCLHFSFVFGNVGLLRIQNCINYCKNYVIAKSKATTVFISISFKIDTHDQIFLWRIPFISNFLLYVYKRKTLLLKLL